MTKLAHNYLEIYKLNELKEKIIKQFNN